ncbi:hypothetical protein [Brevibacillus porteri]|uniref:hypothetical protein n=1 Tax=Brevibacillus porteri TaxID=2126350 RepID=UPI003D1F2C8F
MAKRVQVVAEELKKQQPVVEGGRAVYCTVCTFCSDFEGKRQNYYLDNLYLKLSFLQNAYSCTQLPQSRSKMSKLVNLSRNLSFFVEYNTQ